MTKYRQTFYLFIVIWVPLCTLTGCLSLHNRKKEAALTATVPLSIPSGYKPTITPTLNLSARVTTGTISNAGDSFTPTPIEKSLTVTPQISPIAVETQKGLFATPTQSLKKTSVIPTLPTPTPGPTLMETAPAGWIAFASYVGWPNGVDIIHTSGKGWRRIADFAYPEFLSWSPDGQWIALENDGEIYIVRPDGSDFINLGDPNENVYQWYPSWSPDSQTILYTQTAKHTQNFVGDLKTINIKTRLIRRLTNTPGVLIFAAWSPRGDMIAYLTDNSSLMVMNSDGSSQHSLTSGQMHIRRFVWSPDGNTIIFSAQQKCQNLYQINLDGSGLKNLTDNPGDTYFPAISSSGEWLAFGYSTCIVGTAGIVNNKLNLMRVDGQGLTQLTSNPNVSTIDPSWSPIPGLEIGKTFTITELGNNLKLRASASLSSTVQLKLLKDEKILVLDGPVEADQYLWWHVRLISNGQEGWVAENPGWFEPVSPTVTITPSPAT